MAKQREEIPDGCAWAFLAVFGGASLMLGCAALALVVLLWRWALGY